MQSEGKGHLQVLYGVFDLLTHRVWSIPMGRDVPASRSTTWPKHPSAWKTSRNWPSAWPRVVRRALPGPDRERSPQPDLHRKSSSRGRFDVRAGGVSAVDGPCAGGRPADHHRRAHRPLQRAVYAIDLHMGKEYKFGIHPNMHTVSACFSACCWASARTGLRSLVEGRCGAARQRFAEPGAEGPRWARSMPTSAI